jgi:hypothetical protein
VLEKERLLNKVMSKSRVASMSEGDECRVAISKLRGIPEWSVPLYLEDLHALSLPMDSNAFASFADRIRDLVLQVRCAHQKCDRLILSAILEHSA